MKYPENFLFSSFWNFRDSKSNKISYPLQHKATRNKPPPLEHVLTTFLGQERLCFDFHPTGDISLLIDPESALSVTATTLARPSGRSYMHSVHFSSPLGAHLEFTIEGVTLAGLGDQIPTDPHPLTGHQEYGDISFLETYSKVQYTNFIFINSMRQRKI